MNLGTIWAAVSDFFVSTKLYIILALIVIDVVLAVAVALKTKSFDFTRLGDFLLTMVVPYVLAYLVIHVMTTYVAELSQFLGIGIDAAVFLIIVASLVAAIFDNLKSLGMNVPEPRQANALKEE